MHSKIAEIRKMKAELNAKIKATGKEALQEAFSSFFEANPKIKGVVWRQYTPYFNDGDACTFSVREPHVLALEEDVPDDYSAEYHYEFCLDGEDVFEAGGADGLGEKELTELWNDVMDEDVFKAIFDDHVEVVAHRGGFDVEEYSHE